MTTLVGSCVGCTLHRRSSGSRFRTPWRRRSAESGNDQGKLNTDGFAELCNWVDFHGGFVRPEMGIGVSPKTGIRGLICKSGLSQEDVMGGPVMAIPDRLQMTESAAVQRLTPLVQPLGLPPVGLLPGDMQVALLLAHEKKKERNSMWFPYIELLPENLPCGWRWSDTELDHYLDGLPVNKEDWLMKIKRLASTHAENLKTGIEDALEEYGDELQISDEELMWAICQVNSRAYAAWEGAEVTLNPVIDLINHSNKALPPLGMSIDEMPMTCAGTVDPLDPGDELFVNYTFGKTQSPITTFLDYGFVPEELIEVPLSG